ncbi:MAG: 3-hydroxyacyl-CoA dehydrogenase NAD-binding domain-containing protein [Devosia sp.]
MIPSTARHLVIVGAGRMGAEIAVASADVGDRVTTADLAGKADKYLSHLENEHVAEN